MQAIRVHEGSELRYETVPDPAARRRARLSSSCGRRGSTGGTCSSAPGPIRSRCRSCPGSDGAGVRRDTGEEVVVFPGLGWGDREDAPAEGFGILGGPRDGTYAELIALPVENLFPKPAGLSWAEAAAFPLAAVTAYRGLFSARRPAVGRDRARPRRGQRRLDLRRVSWRCRRERVCS